MSVRAMLTRNVGTAWRYGIIAGLLGLAGVLLVRIQFSPSRGSAAGSEPPPQIAEVSIEPAEEDPAGLPAPAEEGARRADLLAQKIDTFIDAGCRRAGIAPAPSADDAEFQRRVYLDLAGRIPTVPEARQFLEGGAADKRSRLVERLLESADYVNHFTNVWRALLVPQATDERRRDDLLVPVLETWLGRQVRDNVPFDRFAREIIAPRVPARRSAEGGRSRVRPIAFYLANELKPEGLATATARLFLGTKIDCAQCHDHPNDHWTRQQFWELAACFAPVDKAGPQGVYAAVRGVPDRFTLKIGGTDREVEAHFLDGTSVHPESRKDTRAALATWVTRPDNPWFARAAANRFWSFFFGIGLVEPVDEFSDGNPASHPELLDELARQFAAEHFNVKFLIRAITTSRAYQRSSGPIGKDKADARLLASMPVKGLTPEQLQDSLVTATGAAGLSASEARNLFRARFPIQEKHTEYQTSIQHALTLMNDALVEKAVQASTNQTVAQALTSPYLDTPQRIESLFLAALSRKPTSAELSRLTAYVASAGTTEEQQAAYADVLWALLNSAEFMVNH
jgi:hypothetical protein